MKSTFLDRRHHSSNSVEGQSSAGFHNGYIYKIINREDYNVAQVDTSFMWRKPLHCQITTGESNDTDNQRFVVNRAQESERGGQFQVRSVAQGPNCPPLMWDFIPGFKVLVQKVANKEGNQLWYCEETTPGSRVYYIKPTTADLCLTNMGEDEPIAVLPLSRTMDMRQQWMLEPMSYNAEETK